MKLNIFQTVDELLAALAEYFIVSANRAIESHGSFAVVLSGGSSPKKLYSLLASVLYKKKIDWSKVYFFFGDERYVPAASADSNYRLVKEVLFEPLAIDDSHIFPVNTMLSPHDAAQEYMHTIHNFFDGKDPRFHLVLLGLGDNSHTASLFPFTYILHETNATVKEVFLTDQQVYRISFTAPLINKAHQVAFLVYGASKAQAVYNILEEDMNTEIFPAQLIMPLSGDAEWFLDEAAANKLP